jgi:hypothetical protein
MERGRTARSRCATTAARTAHFRVEKEFGCSASAGRRYAKQAECKNVENPGVKSTPGAPTSLRSAHPSSIGIQERIYDRAIYAIDGHQSFAIWQTMKVGFRRPAKAQCSRPRVARLRRTTGLRGFGE